MRSKAICLLVFFCSYVWIAADTPDGQNPDSRVRSQPISGSRSDSDAKSVSVAVPGPDASVQETGKKEEFLISSDVELVLLDVGVKDSRGGFASRMRKNTLKHVTTEML